MATGPTGEIRGLDEFRADLRALAAPATWTRHLADGSRDLADDLADWSQAAARSMGGPFAHFASALQGSVDDDGALIEVADPDANATFWGAKARTGWNAGHGGAPQHPPWIGTSWDPGMPGQGPYAIRAATSRVNEIGDRFDDLVIEVATSTSDYLSASD